MKYNDLIVVHTQVQRETWFVYLWIASVAPFGLQKTRNGRRIGQGRKRHSGNYDSTFQPSLDPFEIVELRHYS